MVTLDVIRQIHDFIWGMPLICLIIIVGVWLTIKLKGLQVTKLKKAFSFMLKEEEGQKGEVSTFQALCISMSATIGIGNITAVASAITIGGPGALLWMIITAFFGMATKYAEGFLAVKYRKIENDRIIGGPYAYIEYGLGAKWKPLAKAFAIFGMFASILGLGTLTQINGIVDATQNVFDKESLHLLSIGKINLSWCSLIAGALIAIFSALVLIGGVKRIGRVCEWIVPIMALTYIAICLLLICCNIKEIPLAIRSIVQMAFSNQALAGGITGITIRNVIQQGVAKGIFTNEAGLGSAPIATATVKSNDPIRQGLVAMTSTFFGTVIICSLTGLCVVLTGAWKENLMGISIADYAFTKGLPFPSIVCSLLILLCIICFAFTTIIGWNLYGVKCLDYLTKGNVKIQKIYNWLYILMVFIGAFLKIDLIWNLAEIINALMAIPNLIAILFLTNDIAKDTNLYFK